MKQGLLYPLAGAPVEVSIAPEDCELEAAEAIALRDQYNAAIAAGIGPARVRQLPHILDKAIFFVADQPSFRAEGKERQ